ncbi:cupin domain-containing protein [Roseateles sp.]|jgi:quercetin dioxygenase-like cupin family protein|uniref:cupin domain-containing protein n=1 Tax=Roseateles sp. TaxID=1971397 RepID=UPI0031DE136D
MPLTVDTLPAPPAAYATPAVCEAVAASEDFPEAVKARLEAEARLFARTWTGQPIRWPADCEARFTRLTIPPGTRLPVHQHPYPRFGWLVQGEIEVVQPDTGRTRILRAGEVIAESIGEWHFGRTVSKEPVIFTLLDVVPRGTASNTVLRDAGQQHPE